jgi:uncharacterized flavoprotein (TIGR03862 family)
MSHTEGYPVTKSRTRSADLAFRAPVVDAGGMAVVAVVGGGPAGLIAAETLAAAGVDVVVFEQMASVGRKFLLAGRGGLNLTHSEEFADFVRRIRTDAPQLVHALEQFGPAQLREWAHGLGEQTFVGSSGRVFPESFRASPLLRAWLARLAQLGVDIRTRHSWVGWPVVVRDRDGAVSEFRADAVVLALGGASWPRTGSDGRWVSLLDATPLQPSNMGFVVAWSHEFASRFGGTPLKDVAVRFGDEQSRGDVMVTSAGVEGGAIYALSSPLRDALTHDGTVELVLDTRPDQSVADLTRRLARRRPKESVASWLRAAGIAPVTVSLLREITHNTIPDNPKAVAELLKSARVHITAPQSLARAISTAGGVRFDDLDDRFMLRARPGVFVAGEMLDWDAPTGGYLLQTCFSTGVAAARGALDWLGARDGAKG